MCTVTVVPHEQGVRLLCNRDEQRTRLPGIPPGIHDLSDQRAVFPVDPQGGGTWVGVNDTGLIVALLNLQPTLSGSSAPRESRGLIVLELLRCTSLSQAMTTAMALDVEMFRPFRAVVVHARSLAVATSRGAAPVECTLRPLDAPTLFTSSSLGDTVVGPPRRQLFERMVLRCRSDGWLDGQARFHDHQWALRPEISVRMERREALTVSRTQVEVTSHTRQLLYEAPVNVHRKPQVHQWCSLH